MMSKLYNYMEHIKEEVSGAKYYAQKYVELKNVNSQCASRYKEMAQSEITHAGYLTDMAREHYNELAWKPEETMKDWERCLGESAEQVAIIKMMLSA